ncbi:MAG: hypothetical protein WBX01_14035 [Nitrososphaeraceae archaeon]
MSAAASGNNTVGSAKYPYKDVDNLTKQGVSIPFQVLQFGYLTPMILDHSLMITKSWLQKMASFTVLFRILTCSIFQLFQALLPDSIIQFNTKELSEIFNASS